MHGTTKKAPRLTPGAFVYRRSAGSDEAVHQVLEIFLTARKRLRIDIRRYRRVGDGLERGALGVNLLAGLARPLGIALLDELVDAAVLDERRRRQQRARQQVEPAYVSVEHVGRVDA